MRLARFPLFLCLFAAFVTTACLRADYKGAVVMDAATGKFLYEENADKVSPPASVTKLMTYLIVHDAIAAGRITLATPVPITVEDYKMGGTQVWLEPGETFSVEELIHALMIQSANDAATALARAAAGSREAFVAQMNARAAALGMTHTTFRTPHGLPPSNRNIAEGDLTSPRDLALLSRELLLRTDAVKYTSVTVRPFGEGVRAAPVEMRNHNHLLGRVEGVDGLKTGFTNAAGFCLAATAQRDGKRLIVVVMGSPSAKVRNARVAELIEIWFPKLPADSFFTGGPVTGVSPVQTSPVSPVVPISSGNPSTSPGVTPAPAPEEELPTVEFKLPARR